MLSVETDNMGLCVGEVLLVRGALALDFLLSPVGVGGHKSPYTHADHEGAGSDTLSRRVCRRVVLACREARLLYDRHVGRDGEYDEPQHDSEGGPG